MDITPAQRLRLGAFFPIQWVKQAYEWWKGHEKVDRPSWDDYFMMMAMLTATRSIDAQWQAGAVLVKDHKIIGTGYNSFPSGMPDELLPNTRPHKYDWVIHSEANALYNCTTDPSGATCYTNGHPCLECMKACFQSGVKNFVVTKGKAAMVDAYSGNKLAVYESLIDAGEINIKEIHVSDVAFNRLTQIFANSN